MNHCCLTFFVGNANCELTVFCEFNDVIDSIKCGCGTDGLSMVVGCNILEPVCVDIDTETFCGTPTYRGKFRELIIGTAKLESTACVAITGTGQAASMSKLCVTAVTSFTKLKTCEIFAVRKDKSIEACNSCTPCDGGLSVTFDCTNLDLDESADDELFIPDLAGECVGSGLMTVSDVKKGIKGSYKPFMSPVN
jgi:hypothetical protein